MTKVVIAVRDLQASIDRYRHAYGLAPPIKQVDSTFGAHLASFGGTPVVLASPLTAQSWLVSRLAQFGESPCAFILRARKAGRYDAARRPAGLVSIFLGLIPANSAGISDSSNLIVNARHSVASAA